MKKSLFMLLLLLFAVQMHAQQVYYVKPVATGLGDGSSWDNAGDLRTALDSVSANTQIWAMAGTYLDSFTIKCPVEIYGSFSGEEDSPDDRDLTNLSSILTTSYAISFCCKPKDHALCDSGYDCTIDGFIIKESGNGYLYGGGICMGRANVTLRNLIIEENFAQCGGGIYLYYCSGRIENVIIKNNYVWDHSAGLFLAYCSNMTLVNVLFEGNNSATGNIPNNTSPQGIISVTRWGGAMYMQNSSAVIINCTFASSNAADSGSAITCSGSTAMVYNTIFDNLEFLRIPNQNPSSITFRNCDLYQTTVRPGGWVLYKFTCINSYPMFQSGLHLQPGSPCKNAGYNLAVPSDVTMDLDLQPRISENSVDMGAYEFQ